VSYKRLEITKFGGPEVMRIVEENDLPEPAGGEVRVKVLAAGAAFTDIMIREGKYPELMQKPPFTLGYDMVGRIDKIGPGVDQFSVGRLVSDLMVIGACSEYICVPAERLTPVPDALDPAEAVSLVLSYVTAYQMLNRIAETKPGQRILIHGAGGAVGSAMLQLAGLKDVEVYGTASKPKHRLISSLGAIPIDYREEDFTERIRALASPGVDAVFDPIGGVNLKRSFSVLRTGGKLVSYGFYNSVMGMGGNVPLDFIKLKVWNILPNSRSTAFYSIGATRKKHPAWFSEDLAFLFDLLKERKISPIIDRKLPISRAAEAYELIAGARVSGKLVFDLS